MRLRPPPGLKLGAPGQPLVAACPSCTLRLKHAYHLLKNVEAARERYRQLWGKPFDSDLSIRHFSACWRRWTWNA
jgi:heterodisulfide reductase subunit B